MIETRSIPFFPTENSGDNIHLTTEDSIAPLVTFRSGTIKVDEYPGMYQQTTTESEEAGIWNKLKADQTTPNPEDAELGMLTITQYI